MNVRIASAILPIFAVGACFGEEPRQKVTAESFYSVENQEPWPYLLYLPEGYEVVSEKKWPLFIWLHGRGLRGRDLERLKQKAKGE